MCCTIIPMFKHVFGREYDDGNMDDRILIQKNTYMLEWMGLNLGNFRFLWDTYGPYSLDLKGVIQEELSDSDKNGPALSVYAQDKVVSIKTVLEEGVEMNQPERFWLELICSIHFLKQNIVKDRKYLLEELQIRKQHFNNREVNERALDIVNSIDELGQYYGNGNVAA